MQRGIYFVYNSQLYRKTVDVPWDKDCPKSSRIMASQELFGNVPKHVQPSLDVSGYAPTQLTKSYSLYYVKSDTGTSLKEVWDTLDKSKEAEFLPPGSKELLYLRSLDERQVLCALSINSFYDVYFNVKNKSGSPAIALCALQLLYEQHKLDYLDDMNKFLHWFWVNCQHPIEWNDIYL